MQQKKIHIYWNKEDIHIFANRCIIIGHTHKRAFKLLKYE